MFFTVKGLQRFITYREWSEIIQSNFEKCYYIPLGALYISEIWIRSILTTDQINSRIKITGLIPV